MEGRLITCELKNYYLVHVYTPNSGQQGLKRLKYKMTTNTDNDNENFVTPLKLIKALAST